MIAIDLNKHLILIQKQDNNLTGNLNQIQNVNVNITMFFIIEEAK